MSFIYKLHFTYSDRRGHPWTNKQSKQLIASGYPLLTEKARTLHSSTLVWRIPQTEEPGGLQSMGSRRVGHGWATSLSLFTFMHWRRKLQPTPVFLPGECQGWGSLVGCCLWGCTDGSDLAAAAAAPPAEWPGWFFVFSYRIFFFFNFRGSLNSYKVQHSRGTKRLAMQESLQILLLAT